MILSFLGSIVLGTSDYLTGPKSDKERFRNSWAKHDVIRGKPVVQEIGQELIEREFDFFFDETFCDPQAEWDRLYSAFMNKEPMPFISGLGFDGTRYLVESLEKDVQKTTRRGGVPVRIEAHITLIEAPAFNLLNDAMGSARDGAPGLGSAGSKPEAKK